MKNEVEAIQAAGAILHSAGLFDKDQDPTEAIRREMQEEINKHEIEREPLEKEWGKVWNTDELRNDFDVHGFMAPFIVVRRKSDGKMGSLMFQHTPRYYFNFKEDR